MQGSSHERSYSVDDSMPRQQIKKPKCESIDCIEAETYVPDWNKHEIEPPGTP